MLSVEIHDEHLIVWMTRRYKCLRRCNHVVAFVRHAAAGINKKAHCCRRIFGLEDFDFFFPPVFKNAEFVGSQSGDGASIIAKYGDIEHSEIDVHRKGELKDRQNG